MLKASMRAYPRYAEACAAGYGSLRAVRRSSVLRIWSFAILALLFTQASSTPAQAQIDVLDESCTISIIDDSYVSQLHMRFYDYEGQPMVEDLGSTNGTFHNGNKLAGSMLVHPGDRIQVGTTVLEAQ